jgi:hypothetical protein
MILRGITISVDYDDVLSLTLPYNRHHFDQFLVVTAPHDTRTKKLCDALGVEWFETDAFYRRGALFNKWLALEEGLDHFGREGWMAVMDADIFWPTEIDHDYQIGKIYTPARYLLDDVTALMVRESNWSQLPLLHEAGCPGWTQIFHADDPHLSTLPWYQTDWNNAGGADTYFHRRWPEASNMRTSWRCLHLGPTWTNWCGRAMARRDGEIIPQADMRLARLRQLFILRRQNKNFLAEKLD